MRQCYQTDSGRMRPAGGKEYRNRTPISQPVIRTEKRYYSARFGQPHPQAQEELQKEIGHYQSEQPGWHRDPHVQRVLRLLGRTVDGLLSR